MGPLGSIMTTAGTMATPPLLGGTLFSSLSFPSPHAHWLSFFLRTKATEGQARRDILCAVVPMQRGPWQVWSPEHGRVCHHREGSEMWKSE